MVRPLSQTGFHRLPRNAKARRILEGGVPLSRRALAAFNDRQHGGFLHPTKGWRSMSAKRSVAALITAEVKTGMRAFSSLALREALP